MTAGPAFRLPAASIDTILGELHGLQDGAAAPRLSVWLRSGQRLTGSLINYARPTAKLPAAGGVVMIKADRSHDITYVSLSAIEAVTVHVTPETLHVLSLGTLRPQRPPGTTPGWLTLRRRLGEIAQRLTASGWSGALEVAWDELPDTEPARAAVDDALGDVEAALIAITGDALGAAALRDQVTRVLLTSGVTAGASLDDGGLHVTGSVEPDHVRWLAGAALREAIEKAL